MSASFTIRPGRKDDMKALVEFQQAMAMETEGLSLDPKTLERGIAAVLSEPAKGKYWMAEESGQVIASLMVTFEWSDWRNMWVWWIQSVYVKPEARGRGVYSMMYRHLQNEVRKDSSVSGLRLYVDKRNKSANEVYRKLGMDGEHYAMFEWIP